MTGPQVYNIPSVFANTKPKAFFFHALPLLTQDMRAFTAPTSRTEIGRIGNLGDWVVRTHLFAVEATRYTLGIKKHRGSLRLNQEI